MKYLSGRGWGRSNVHGAYLSQLMAERARTDNEGAMAADFIAPGNGWSQTDTSNMYLIETEMLSKLEGRELMLKVLAFRWILKNLLTQDEYAEIHARFVTDMSVRKELLEEAAALASRIYRRYALVPAVESLKASITAWMMAVVGAAIAGTIALTYYKMVALDGYWLAALAGATGAAVSTTMRLHQINPRHEPLLTWLSLERGKTSLWVAPILGAVFGLLMLLFFRAGLVQGELFPRLDSWQWMSIGPDSGTAICNTHPCSAIRDIAKLLIWAFAAGWAERLIPDVLNKLAKESFTMPSMGAKSSEDALPMDPQAFRGK